MVALTKWVQVRSLAIAVGLGALLSLVIPLHSRTDPVQAQQSTRAAVIQRYFEVFSAGEVDASMALFTDDAVFVGARAGSNCSQQTPCTDTASHRQQVQSNVTQQHPCQTLTEVQVAGTIVSGRIETRADAYAAMGIERTVQSFIAVVPQDKITFLAILSDVADPQTATLAGVQPPRTPLPGRATQCGEA